MIHILKLTDHAGTVARITSATVDVEFEDDTYLAGQGIIFHDLPGAQNGLDTDDFRLALLDGKNNRRWRDFFLPRYLKVPLDVRTLSNDHQTEYPEYRYQGKSAAMVELAAPEGLALRFVFRGPLDTRGVVREVVTVDEFQRIENATDDLLQYADRSRKAITEGINLG